jgi:hypothetical protein
MSVVMWVTGILLLVGTATLLGAVRTQEAAAAAHRDLVERGMCATEFRADVAAAEAAPHAAGDLKAGPTCLLLRTPGGGQVVYRWADGKLERSATSGPKTTRRRLAPGRDVTAVTFGREGPDGRLITLRLTESLGPNTAEKRQSAVVAALGGDLR